MVFILEKFVFTLWELQRMPTYFSDSLKTWSAQGHSIYGGVNFNLSGRGGEFLTRKLQLVIEYPLQLPIWRAVEGTLNGEWNEFVSRADGLFFLLVIAFIIGGTFWRLFGKKWIALTAILVIVSLPLQVWHAASGYADIAVEAYVVAALAAFIRKEWWLCGLLMAGATWAKNDGLAIFLPGVLVAVFVYHVFSRESTFLKRFLNMVQFGLGAALMLPWIVFQALYTHSVFSRIIKPLQGLLSSTHYDPLDYQVVLTQAKGSQPSSISLIWDYVFLGSTHSVFWWIIILGLLICSKNLIMDRMGRSILLFFLITVFVIFYVFTYTDAYQFLLIQTTFHRTLLQFSAAALLIVGYGMSLFYKERIVVNLDETSPKLKLVKVSPKPKLVKNKKGK